MSEIRPRTVVLAAVTLVLPACGDHGPPGAVAECVEYEATMSSCFHRPSTGFASQASLIPKDDADRERIRQSCAANLDRLKRACR